MLGTGHGADSCASIRFGHEADRAPGRASAGNLAHRARCPPGKTRPLRSRGGKRGSPCPQVRGSLVKETPMPADAPIARTPQWTLYEQAVVDIELPEQTIRVTPAPLEVPDGPFPA